MRYKNTTRFDMFLVYSGSLKLVSPGGEIDVPPINIPGLVALDKLEGKVQKTKPPKKTRRKKTTKHKPSPPKDMEPVSVSGIE